MRSRKDPYEYLNETEAAHAIGICVTTMRNRLEKGDGPKATRITKNFWAYHKQDVEEYIQEQTNEDGLWYDTRRAAEYLGITNKQFYELHYKENAPVSRKEKYGRRMYHIDDLKAWKENQK